MAEKSRSFKKTTLEVEVLSEGDWDWESLKDVAHSITDGGCSGSVETKDVTFLTEEQTARALLKQGSDPGFLLGGAWEGWEPPTEDEPGSAEVGPTAEEELLQVCQDVASFNGESMPMLAFSERMGQALQRMQEESHDA